MSTEMIPEGWHDGKAKSWRWTQATTGTWQLEITFDVSDRGSSLGERAGWFAITDNTITKRVEQFEAMGYTPKTGDLGEEIGSDDKGCWGGLDKNPVRVFIEHNEYNGRVTERVSNVSKGNGGARASTVDQGALKKFGAQMRAAVMAAAGRANGAQAPARQPTPARAPAKPRGFAPEVAEDDVPF